MSVDAPELQSSVKLCCNMSIHDQHVASLMDLDGVTDNNIGNDTNPSNFLSVSTVESNTEKVSIKKNFSCPKCKMTFVRVHNVRRHIAKVHPLEAKDLLVTTPKTYRYKCEHCKRQYNKLSHYNYHKRKVHSESAPQREFDEITCPECQKKFEKKDVFSHYKQDHHVELKTEILQFQTFKEFNVWKENISITSCSKFNLERTKKSHRFMLYNFICHRSGFFKSKGKGLRRLKTKGSTKIDSLCPSKIKVKQDINGKCYVEYQSTHFGHQIDLNHLPLSCTERRSIVEKIAARLPHDIILDQVKKSVLNSDGSRLQLVTKKDLHNIAASYHKKCNNDDNKKKLAYKLNEIHERHELSLTFQAEIMKNNGLWVLKSVDLNELCTVKENLLECHCELICTNCKICIHRYSCSCTDSAINLNMCKHIHFFSQYKDGASSNIAFIMVDVVQQDFQCSENNYSQEVVLNALNFNDNNFELNLSNRKRTLIENYSKLINSLSSATELDLMEKNLELLETTLTAARIAQTCQ